MRLGLRPSFFQEGSEWSKLRALYGNAEKIDERHRVSITVLIIHTIQSFAYHSH